MTEKFVRCTDFQVGDVVSRITEKLQTCRIEAISGGKAKMSDLSGWEHFYNLLHTRYGYNGEEISKSQVESDREDRNSSNDNEKNKQKILLKEELHYLMRQVRGLNKKIDKLF